MLKVGYKEVQSTGMLESGTKVRERETSSKTETVKNCPLLNRF